jgi:hypothetical protein
MKKIILLVALATFGLSCQTEDLPTTPEVSATGIYPNGKSFKDVYSATFDKDGIPTILIDYNRPAPVELPASEDMFFQQNSSANQRGLTMDRNITYKYIGCYQNGVWKPITKLRPYDLYITATKKNCGNQIDIAFRFLPRDENPAYYMLKQADFWYRVQINSRYTTGDVENFNVKQMLRSGSTERTGNKPFYDWAWGLSSSEITAGFLRQSDNFDQLFTDNCINFTRGCTGWLIQDCNDHKNTDGKNRLDLWIKSNYSNSPENMVFREDTNNPWTPW